MLGMEGEFFEVDMKKTLEVKRLFDLVKKTRR